MHPKPVWRGHSCPRPLILLLFLILILSTPAFTQDKPVALKGGKLLTVTHGVIENGVVVMQGGKITAVGAASSVTIPSAAHVIDATGMTIYPGLIDSETPVSYTHLDVYKRQRLNPDSSRVKGSLIFTPANRRAVFFQNTFAESSIMVTGPSFTSSICIVSWKRPVSQRSPAARTFSTKYS